jgi:hypothetical protein
MTHPLAWLASWFGALRVRWSEATGCRRCIAGGSCACGDQR